MSMKKVLSFAFIGLCAICHCGIDCFTVPQSGRATRNSRYYANTGTDVHNIQGTSSSIIKHHLMTSGSSDCDSDSDDDDDDDSSCSDSSSDSDSDSSTSTSSSDISSNCCGDDDDDDDDVINQQKKQDRYTKEVWLSVIGLTCSCLVLGGVGVKVGVVVNVIATVIMVNIQRDVIDVFNPQKIQGRYTKVLWLLAIGLMVGVGVEFEVGLYFDQHPLPTGISRQDLNYATADDNFVLKVELWTDNFVTACDNFVLKMELRTLYLNYATAFFNCITFVSCIATVIMANIQRDAIAKNSMSDKTDCDFRD